MKEKTLYSHFVLTYYWQCQTESGKKVRRSRILFQQDLEQPKTANEIRRQIEFSQNMKFVHICNETTGLFKKVVYYSLDELGEFYELIIVE